MGLFNLIERNKSIILLVCALFVLCYIMPVEAKTNEETYQERLAQVHKVYPKEYLTLARWCKSNKLYSEAKDYFKKVVEYESDNKEAKSELHKGFPTDNPQDTEQVLNEYDKKSVALEKKLADEHTKLGVWCKENKLSDESEKEFNQAIELYEDHPEARKQLNQERVNGFGWVDKETAVKLRQGLREYQGKWLPKSEVEKIRSNWTNAWEIRTKHYLVKTNTTYEKGYEVAQYAEDTYQMYFKIFGRALNLKEPTEPLVVYFFRSFQEFKNGSVTSSPPPPTRNGHYQGKSQITSVWNFEGTITEKGLILQTLQDVIHHECTHQLDHLVTSATTIDPQIIKRGGGGIDTWLSEGLAPYFESIRQDKTGIVTVGQKGHYRFSGFTLSSLRELLTKKGNEMSNKDYNYAATLVKFFLNGPGVKYKQQFLKYIKRHYTVPIDLQTGFRQIDPLKTFEECFDNVGLEQIEKEFFNGWNK